MTDNGIKDRVYEPKSRLLKKNWHNIDAPFEWMHLRQTIAFLPNRLVLLVKSAKSWHGVGPLKCPEGRRRRSLLVTIQHCREAENVIQRRFYGFMKARAVRAIRARM